MQRFAQLLNTLYFTYSHLDKMTLIHQYFKTTPDPERGYALAVMADNLEFPTFKRAMIRELVQEQIDPFLFGLSYDYVGDISDTIALIWPEPETYSQLPLLSELITTFNSLSPSEIKEYLYELLNKGNAIERWALLKLGTGSLRIGVSARFLKNVLAKYGQVDVQEVEQIWHSMQAPYEDLFKWLEHKSDKPSSAGQIYFHPVMLSHPLDEKDLLSIQSSDYSFERKYDGIRVQIIVSEKGKALYTRTGDNISHAFPDVLESFNSPVVLDGELIIIKDKKVCSFNELQQRLNRKVVSKKLLNDLPAGVILYDILSVNDQDIRHLGFVDRRVTLEQWLNEHPAANVQLSDLLTLKTNQSLVELKQQILDEHHPAVEGLMIKKNLSPYLAGRPKGHWYKWKRDPLVVDAVLMYAQRGQGKRSSFYSDYTFGLWKEGQLLPIGKAYFGFTDEELLALDKWIRHHTLNHFGPVREVSKELVFEVAFDAVNLSTRHKSGVALRFPRINRIRWDKPASEADQLDELMKLIG